MPAPPARNRSASVPCGINSSSSSPARTCRSNSLFSPTYDAITFFTWRAGSKIPIPKPSTPALLPTIVKPLTPLSWTAAGGRRRADGRGRGDHGAPTARPPGAAPEQELPPLRERARGRIGRPGGRPPGPARVAHERVDVALQPGAQRVVAEDRARH